MFFRLRRRPLDFCRAPAALSFHFRLPGAPLFFAHAYQRYLSRLPDAIFHHARFSDSVRHASRIAALFRRPPQHPANARPPVTPPIRLMLP